MSVTVRAELDRAERDAVVALAAEVAAADGVEAISEQPLLDVRRPGGRPVLHALVHDGDALVAYAQADLDSGTPTSVELAVRPDGRRRGHGTAALAALREAVAEAGERAGTDADDDRREADVTGTRPEGTGEAGAGPDAGGDPESDRGDTAAPGTLSGWAHGDLAPARAFAAARGLRRTRDLHVMGLDLAAPGEAAALEPAGGDGARSGPPEPAPGTRIDTFRPGVDEDAWVTLNAAAFASHPEQGRMTAEDLRAREEEPWFDADRLWLVRSTETTEATESTETTETTEPDAPEGGPAAVRGDTGAGDVPATPAPGELLASMWVKAPPGTGEAEIYALAVHPGAQGRGLGGLLTEHALADARARGDSRMTLYVDGDNRAAVRVYERAGFGVDETHAQYTGRPARRLG